MRQAGLLAAAGQHALEHHIDRLAEDDDNARTLAAGLAALGRTHDGLHTDVPQTNIVFVKVDDAIAASFTEYLAAHGVRTTGSSGRYGQGMVQRWVTHLDVTRADVDEALTIAARFFEQRL